MPAALITGASSGIGLELARIFASKGYRLILVARSKLRLEQVAEELNPAPVQVLANVISRVPLHPRKFTLLCLKWMSW